MSKTDTVPRFSLIFARKVPFSENSSVRKNFCQNLAEASNAKPLIVEDHDDARALHCRWQASPGRQHCLAVRVAALLTRPGLQAVELAAKAVAVLGALP